MMNNCYHAWGMRDGKNAKWGCSKWDHSLILLVFLLVMAMATLFLCHREGLCRAQAPAGSTSSAMVHACVMHHDGVMP